VPDGINQDGLTATRKEVKDQNMAYILTSIRVYGFPVSLSLSKTVIQPLHVLRVVVIHQSLALATIPLAVVFVCLE
jgi:hypothetical protein